MSSGFANLFPLLLSLAAVSFISTGAAVVGRVASEQNSYLLLGISVLIFSVTSWLIFRIYQTFETASFISVSFYSLLLTVMMSLLASAYFLNEPVNWRGLAVILVAIGLYTATLKSPPNMAASSQSPHSTSHNGE